MKKRILSIALILSVIAGGLTASAQTIDQQKPQTEQASKDGRHNGKKDKKDKKDKDAKKDKKGDRHNSKKDKGARKGERPNPFEGITLSAEQQAQFEALKAERKEANKAQKAEKSKKEKEARESRRAEFDAKVKSILTPEQYAIYQQNIEKMKQNRQK